MNAHEIEEMDFGRGSRLWDADPDVCCAAFQLGACEHTEAYEDGDEDALAVHANRAQVEEWRGHALECLSRPRPATPAAQSVRMLTDSRDLRIVSLADALLGRMDVA